MITSIFYELIQILKVFCYKRKIRANAKGTFIAIVYNKETKSYYSSTLNRVVIA